MARNVHSKVYDFGRLLLTAQPHVSLPKPARCFELSAEGVEVKMTAGRNLGLSGSRSNTRGFSLIELLIVVAIILIIAAIAIPNFLRAKMSANESAAVSSIHAINTAEIAYSSANPTIGFSVLLVDLGPAGGAYIDGQLASGTKSGYGYTYAPVGAAPSTGYTLNVDPLTRGVTGQRSFFSSEVAVTRYNQTAAATANDNAIQ
jgi:type IV pilus assembly protein PilA